jgi:hypothetical protein
MMPYYIDFFSNKKYSLLPLSSSQDFFNEFATQAWGKNDYSNLISLYTDYIKKGYPVYVHNYGLMNVDKLHADFNKIQDSFTLQKVAEGCFGACDIWQLYLK